MTAQMDSSSSVLTSSSSSIQVVIRIFLLGVCIDSCFANERATSSSSQVRLVFEDNFETFNLRTWKHEISLAGGGNWEFSMYTNNRTNSYVDDNTLFIQPTLTADNIGYAQVDGSIPYTLDVWGLGPPDTCSGNAFWGCSRSSDKGANIVLNPVQSARITTSNSFAFKYGRFEVEAKLPKGDWIWPAIWLLPLDNNYGGWPASGEIDVMESRGNTPGYCPGTEPRTDSCAGGYEKMGSTLHWGPTGMLNRFEMTTKSQRARPSPHSSPSAVPTFHDDFHVFGLHWTEDGLYTYIDDDSNRVLEVDYSHESFWERGNFDGQLNVNNDNPNPWKGRSNAAPFDQMYYIIINVAVGGVGGYFPDGGSKPWKNTDTDAMAKFWADRHNWYPTWSSNKPDDNNQHPARDSALQIKSVRVWQRVDDGGKSLFFKPTQQQEVVKEEQVSLPPSSAEGSVPSNTGEGDALQKEKGGSGKPGKRAPINGGGGGGVSVVDNGSESLSAELKRSQEEVGMLNARVGGLIILTIINSSLIVALLGVLVVGLYARRHGPGKYDGGVSNRSGGGGGDGDEDDAVGLMLADRGAESTTAAKRNGIGGGGRGRWVSN